MSRYCLLIRAVCKALVPVILAGAVAFSVNKAFAETKELVSVPNPAADTQAVGPTKTGLDLGRFKSKSTVQDGATLATNVPDIGLAAGKVSKGVVYCLAFILLAFYVYHQVKLRNRSAGQQGNIEILARQGLSPRSVLLVVRAEERKFLLSQNGDEVNLLAELDPVSDFQEAFARLALGEDSENKAVDPAWAVNG